LSCAASSTSSARSRRCRRRLRVGADRGHHRQHTSTADVASGTLQHGLGTRPSGPTVRTSNPLDLEVSQRPTHVDSLTAEPAAPNHLAAPINPAIFNTSADSTTIRHRRATRAARSTRHPAEDGWRTFETDRGKGSSRKPLQATPLRPSCSNAVTPSSRPT